MPPGTTVNQETISTFAIHQEIAIAAPIEIAWVEQDRRHRDSPFQLLQQ